MMTMQVLPAQRTPVHVWPIVRMCRTDREATGAVVARLNANLGWEVHQLAPPGDPAYLGCSGAGCAALLGHPGCDPRSGIFVGGEVDEAACDAADPSLAGCHGQVLTRVRVFRFDLDQNRPMAGEYRYELCQDGRCGSEGRTVEETVAQLIEQLVRAAAVASPPQSPRATPLPEEQCKNPQPVAAVAAGAAALAPPSALPPAQAPLPSTVAFAYYTQFAHLAAGKAGAASPTSDQAEQQAKARAAHFLDGTLLPPGPQYVQTVVNTKYALLPGEVVAGNAARIGTLQKYLSVPPAGPDFEPLRADKSGQKALVVLVFDHETEALTTYVIEPAKPLRPVTTPASCQAGGGESAACINAAIVAALGVQGDAPAAPVATPVAAVAAVGQRSLGCLRFAERSCTALCSAPPAAAPAAVLPPPPAPPPPAHSSLRNWADGLLYAALAGSLITATALTIADLSGGPTQLTDVQGDVASVSGILRPAEWTAWGLTIGFAVPAILSMADRARTRARPPEAPLPVAPPPPRCPIGEGHL